MYSRYQVVEWLKWGRRSWNIPKIGPTHPHFVVCSIFGNMLLWLIDFDWLIVWNNVFWYDVKVYLFLKFIQYTIYWEKTQIIEKFLQTKYMLQKIRSFFLARDPTYRSFPFNSGFLYELKHKVQYFSQSFCAIVRILPPFIKGKGS